ncbi:MAG: HEPN domain-containing protein [Proteiniphilum sp.]
MKQQLLTDTERRLLVDYRLQRAKETLAEADSLIESAFYNAVVNRLYYACYYAVIALLVKHNITAANDVIPDETVKKIFTPAEPIEIPDDLNSRVVLSTDKRVYEPSALPEKIKVTMTNNTSDTISDTH